VLFKSVAVLELNPRVGEMDVSVMARQVVILRPTGNLLGCAVGPAGGVGAPAIPLVQELLVLTLELVVEDDPANASTLVVKLRLSLSTGAINLDVVGQLARLPETSVERLLPLAGVLTPASFEKVTPAISGNHDILVPSLHRDALQQAGGLEVVQTPLRGPLAALMAQQLPEVAGLNDAKRRHGGECLDLAAIQLAGAPSLANDLALGPAR
jgi:hypothetical protein